MKLGELVQDTQRYLQVAYGKLFTRFCCVSFPGQIHLLK